MAGRFQISLRLLLLLVALIAYLIAWQVQRGFVREAEIREASEHLEANILAIASVVGEPKPKRVAYIPAKLSPTWSNDQYKKLAEKGA